MNPRQLPIPSQLEVNKEKLTDTYGEFVYSPLPRGWAWTIGTMLRRILMSSIEGCAPTEMRIDGVQHEFSTIDGVLEDVPTIVMYVKKLRFRMNTRNTTEMLYLHGRGKKQLFGKDISLPPGIELMNPDQLILTITDDVTNINMEIKIEKGRGWESQEMVKHRNPHAIVGTITLDAFYSPVRRVDFEVDNVRFEEFTDFEKLILKITTDGTIKPEEAIVEAAKLGKLYLSPIIEREEKSNGNIDSLRLLGVSEGVDLSIEEIKIPETVRKILRARGKTYVRDIIVHTEDEILSWGVKPRSLKSLKNALEKRGLKLGINVGIEEGNNEA